MSIDFKKFIPRPGLVNKQGLLPDPYELVCIEVPKIFDQCLIKKCLVYGKGPDTNTTDCELRSDPLECPRRYLRSRDFDVTLLAMDKLQIKRKPNFKKIILQYKISFYADYIDEHGVNQSEFYEINRTDVIGKFYCPDSIAQFSGNFVVNKDSKESGGNIVKIEMVAEALDGDLVECEDGNNYLDITLGYFLIVKSELIVQLLVPAYGYCPVADEPCKEEPDDNPCDRFNNAPIPKFYPDQNLRPLFPDYYDNERTHRDGYVDEDFDEAEFEEFCQDEGNMGM